MSQNQTINLGVVSIPVGSYTSKDPSGKEITKKRWRNIGHQMKTTDQNGTRYWLRLNADILHASLYALVRATDMEKGDDQFTAQVFEPRDNGTKTNSGQQQEPDGADEGLPYE